MSDDKRGNESPEHARVKAELYDILVRAKKGPIKKEHKIQSLIEPNKTWIIDVADLSDPAYPIFYEVQKVSNKSFRAKQKAFARHTGKDLVPIYVNKMPDKIKKNMVAFRQWVEDQVI